jgi:superoxide dismutase
MDHMTYQAKSFNLSGLKGISDKTLEMHFKLYEGYVKETNRLNEKISAILKDGKVDQEETPAYSELTRRLGFEFNGMVLHEYYFGNMKRGGGGRRPGENVPVSSELRAVAEQLRAVEDGLRERWKNARRRLGHLLSKSCER